jgi:cobalt-zinc-cadmium efflux system protein
MAHHHSHDGHGAHDHAHDHEHNDHDDHNHSASLGHVHAPASFGRAFAIGVVLNLAFVVVEVIYGVLGNSVALLADAGHNVSDVLGLAVAWLASVLSKRAPSKKFTFGLGGTSILAAQRL